MAAAILPARPRGLISRTMFAGALVFLPGRGVFVWSHDGAIEAAASPVPLAHFVDEAAPGGLARIERHGRPFVVVPPEWRRRLDRFTQREVDAILRDRGRWTLLPAGAGLTRQRAAPRGVHLVAAEAWAAALAVLAGVEIAQADAVRVLRRVEEIEQDAERAERTCAQLGRCIRLFYARRDPRWHLYEARAARLWQAAEEAFAAVFGWESPRFLRCCEVGERSLTSEFILLTPAEAEGWATSIAHRVERGGF